MLHQRSALRHLSVPFTGQIPIDGLTINNSVAANTPDTGGQKLAKPPQWSPSLAPIPNQQEPHELPWCY